MSEFTKFITDIGGLGIAGLALLVFVYFLKNNNRFSKLNKKVNNDFEHRLISIEKRIDSLEGLVEKRMNFFEKEMMNAKEEIGYLRGKMNNK